MANEMDIKEIKEIIMNAGDAFDGGCEECREEIADEWAYKFEGVNDPMGTIQVLVNAGYWDTSIAREIYDHVNHPSYYLEDQLSEFREKYNPIWEQMSLFIDGMDVVYALCNNDISLTRLHSVME